jgi:Domain of unknown function (DUF6946)
MRVHKSGHEILSVEDWFKYAAPKRGELQWKDKRSAKELAQSWCRNGTPNPPDALGPLMEAKFGTRITFDEAKPECIIELDDFVGEHRNCDLVVLCNVGTKRMVIIPAFSACTTKRLFSFAGQLQDLIVQFNEAVAA